MIYFELSLYLEYLYVMREKYSDWIMSAVCIIFLVLALSIISIILTTSSSRSWEKSEKQEDHLDILFLQGRLSIHKYSLETGQTIVNPHAICPFQVCIASLS